MAKTKTSGAAKERFNAKAYDDIRLRVPIGQKSSIRAAADADGISLNSYVNKAVLARMGLEEWPKRTPHMDP